MKKSFCLIPIVIAIISVQYAPAQISSFTSEAAFSTHISSNCPSCNSHNEEFDGFTPGQSVTQLNYGNTQISLNQSIFFGAWYLFPGCFNTFSGGSLLSTPVYGTAPAVLNFSNPVYAFGGNFYDDGAPVGIITLTVTTAQNHTQSISETCSVLGDTGFLGFASSEGITQIKFTITFGAVELDHMKIATFCTTETCNGLDDNCNGIVDEGFDQDGDGYKTCGSDCNDNDFAIYPGATETCNSVDDDCDGQIDEGVLSTFYTDADSDSYGNANSTTSSCSAPPGYVANSTDCNDNDFAVYPGATETCNSVDDDCDGQIDEGVFSTFFADTDGDSYGNANSAISACPAPACYGTNSTDCNDNNADINPSATETCNGTDDDCDGLIDEDHDLDGDGYTNCGGDCDDGRADVYPGAIEACDAVDHNCDGETTHFNYITLTYSNGSCVGGSFDASVQVGYTGDFVGNLQVGFGLPQIFPVVLYNSMIQPASASPQVFEFTDIPINPAYDSFLVYATFDDYPTCFTYYTVEYPQPSICDSDNDGAFGATDCDETNPAIYPGAPEICNAVDDDCDGNINEGLACCLINLTNVTMTNETCPGAGNGSIVITADSPYGTLAYSINSGQTYQFSDTFDNLSPSTYGIKVKISGNGQCFVTASATINPAPPSAMKTWYKDLDDDGYSDGMTQQACDQPIGFKLPAQLTGTTGDCNDNDPFQFPGQTWYEDADSDSYSNGQTLVQCSKPISYKASSQLIAISGDCNDNNPSIKPGATEVCNSVDDDCDGQNDEGLLGLTFVGNANLISQAAVNNWASCYSVIQGNLTIKNAGVINLLPLSNLEKVTGNVTIQLTSLDSLTGLHNLDSIGGNLTIYSHSTSLHLISLSGLDSLVFVGGSLKVYQNHELGDCCAIQDLVNEVNGHHVGGTIVIHSNASACTSISAINSNCGNLNMMVPIGKDTDWILTGAFHLFPNPSKEEITVVIQGEHEDLQLQVFDTTGKMVWKGDLEAHSREAELDASGWMPGLYLVKMRMDGIELSKKLVIGR